MKQTINLSDFHDAFHRAGRANQFSHQGRRALFEYLEQLEDDTGEEIELDVVALCCEYAEETLSDALKNYELDSLSQLEWYTTVIMVDEDKQNEENSTVIYQIY